MDWSRLFQQIDMALQPLVGLHTGKVLGYEALVRLVGEDAPTINPFALFDAARRDNQLYALEKLILAGAFAKFSAVRDGADDRLFINLDPGSLIGSDEIPDHVQHLTKRFDMVPEQVVFELSERRSLLDITSPLEVCDLVAQARKPAQTFRARMKKVSVRLALDDFGSGQASLPLLYLLRPDFVKLNRFFVSGLSADTSRRLYLRHLVNLAHQEGIRVVAVGVDDADDYHVCRDSGCDMVQGLAIAAPETDPKALRHHYGVVRRLNRLDNRGRGSDRHLLQARMAVLEPIPLDTPMVEVFERFRTEKLHSFFPVINQLREPIGIIREFDMKELAYSLYGKDLVSNKGLGRTLKDYLWRCPVVEMSTPAEVMLEIFSSNTGADGLLMTQDGVYVGYLTAASLLRVINEKNLALARDQNPLTKLPGNTLIGKYVADLLALDLSHASLVYLDFDNFKPFNDGYGFRQGDRAILMFAELMRKLFPGPETFLAHIGGDDFFIGFKDVPQASVEEAVSALISQFSSDCLSFYDAETREAGRTQIRDRQGDLVWIPLLAVSAAVIHLCAGHGIEDADEIGERIAALKKQAKASPEKMAVLSTP
ncbi:MAG: EAL domain-containing protein [Rhodospirillaceae bacterium]